MNWIFDFRVIYNLHIQLFEKHDRFLTFQTPSNFRQSCHKRRKTKLRFAQNPGEQKFCAVVQLKGRKEKLSIRDTTGMRE